MGDITLKTRCKKRGERVEGRGIKGEEGRNVSRVAMRLAPATPAAQRAPAMVQPTLSDSIGAGNEDGPVLTSPQKAPPTLMHFGLLGIFILGFYACGAAFRDSGARERRDGAAGT